MNNGTKIATAVGLMLATLAMVVWLQATPSADRPTDFEGGSLGRAVVEHCSPSRQGNFTGPALNEALACRDLAAQESMALSTQRLVWLNWLQIVVAVGGTGAVLWTLLISIRSTNLTREALVHQQNTSRRELRPSLTFEGATLTKRPNGGARIVVRFVNSGATSARNFQQGFAALVAPIKETTSSIKPGKLRDFSSPTNIARGADSGFFFTIGPASYATIAAGTHAVQIVYYAIYEDEMGGRYGYKFSRSFFEPDLSGYRTLMDVDFPDALMADRDF